MGATASHWAREFSSLVIVALALAEGQFGASLASIVVGFDCSLNPNSKICSDFYDWVKTFLE